MIELEVGKRYKFEISNGARGKFGDDYVYCVSKPNNYIENSIIADIIEIEKKPGFWVLWVDDVEYI